MRDYGGAAEPERGVPWLRRSGAAGADDPHRLPYARTFFSAECERAHTLLSARLLECGLATWIWRQEANMAPKPDRLAFLVGMALAMAVAVLAITTGAGPSDRDSASAAPLSAREPIFRPQNWAVY